MKYMQGTNYSILHTPYSILHTYEGFVKLGASPGTVLYCTVNDSFGCLLSRTVCLLLLERVGLGWVGLDEFDKGE